MSDCTHDCSSCGESCAERQEGSPFQIAAAAGNGRAVVARYTGHGDLEEHLEELIQMTAPAEG